MESEGVRERWIEKEEINTPLIFLLPHHHPLLSLILSQYFAKKQSVPSLLTVGRYIVISYNACNCQTRLNGLVRREVKNMYVRTYVRMYRLTYARIKFIRANR